MARTPQDEGPPPELEPTPETRLGGRQPYHWPRGPEIPSRQERRSRSAWIMATAVAFAALVFVLAYIIQYRY